MKVEIKIQKLQDDDSHWYWIPLSMVEEFEEDLEYITKNKYYAVGDELEAFTYKYERFRTYGSSDNIPDFYK